jgi:CHASE2 domain-containing sensor protein
LQAFEPRVIGLDLYRDLPQGEGHADLMQTLAANPIIAIRKMGNRPSEAIPAPPTVPPERVGFNDFPVDADGIIRRNLLFATPNNHPETASLYSFSMRLALAYLETENILPLASDVNPRYLDLDGTVFIPLTQHFGGYRAIDEGGYQVLLQYRSAKNAVARLSLSDVLSGQFTAEMIRDRIVIIGTTAPSAKDLFFTPFSATAEADFLMPGVLLHVHATSQILSSVLDGRPLPWAFPEGAELGWIVLWAISGAGLGWWGQRLWLLGLGLVGGAIALVLIPASVFMVGGWLPVMPATVAFIGSTIGTALSRSYGRRRAPVPTVSPMHISPTATPLQK